MAQKSKAVTWFGIVLLIIIGAIHVIDAPDSFGDAVYKGWLFILNGLGCLVAAIGIFLGRRVWGWKLGFVIASLSFTLYVLSRTVGLPLLPAEPENWLEPLGVAALVTEGLFILLVIKTLGRRKT